MQMNACQCVFVLLPLYAIPPAAYGTITSTYDPRQLQLGVKVLW